MLPLLLLLLLLQLCRPSLAQVPEECMLPGLQLQTDCSVEVNAAADAFGVDIGAAELPAGVEIDQAAINAYLADPANTISAE